MALPPALPAWRTAPAPDSAQRPTTGPAAAGACGTCPGPRPVADRLGRSSDVRAETTARAARHRADQRFRTLVEAFAARVPGLPEPVGAHGIVTTVALPLLDAQRQPIAALAFGWHRERPLREGDLALLDTIADAILDKLSASDDDQALVVIRRAG
ncbi:GAF domain-containing protein [Micromonospora sp. KC723]|uniref:GAF domain-containing protein n=1 Tax=Micromonospora sp. KC723 TaxID=2530381 RepID=UPI00104F58B9|nr:GAF domain-containing protein [Micromonospora sp. KC723]TDB76101.1 GAF domain-containing protein [Micromonospora sp. KC723]